MSYGKSGAATILSSLFQLEIARNGAGACGFVRQTRTRSVNREDCIFPEVELDREDPKTRRSATKEEEEQERLIPRLLRGYLRVIAPSWSNSGAGARAKSSCGNVRKCPTMSRRRRSSQRAFWENKANQSHHKEIKNIRRELEMGIDVVGARAWVTEQTH
jgi:hypothetical protein